MSSKVFETQLYIKNYKDKLIKTFIAYGVNDIKIEAIDNWEYENKIPIESLNRIEENIIDGKIVVIEGKYKDLNCGCYISKLADDCYEFDIWVPTKIDSALDDEFVSEQNSYLYDTVVYLLKKCIEPRELIFCVSGIEMNVKFSNDINLVLDNSFGVLQMICLCETVKSQKVSFNVRQDEYYGIIRVCYDNKV